MVIFRNSQILPRRKIHGLLLMPYYVKLHYPEYFPKPINVSMSLKF